MEDVKQPSEADMMYTIDDDIFFVREEYLNWRLRCIIPYHQQQYWPI